MRRRQAAIDMENANSKTVDSKFFTKLIKIPIVSYSVSTVTGVYNRTKDTNAFLKRSLGMMEAVTIGVASNLALPIAQRMSAPLGKIDEIALKGLESLESRVPRINKDPQEIVSETKDMITAKVSPVVATFYKAQEVVCKTVIAQKTFDVVEYLLGVTEKTLDMVLPPGQADEKLQQNGGHNLEKPTDDAARGGYLARKYVTLVTLFSRRLFGVAQARVETAAATTDVVIKSAQKAFSRPTNTS